MKRCFNCKGFGIIELLIVSSVLLGVLLAVSQLTTSTLKSAAASRASFTKGNLGGLIVRYSGDPDILRRSAAAAQNNATTFNNCVNGVTAAGCNANAGPQGISLIDATNTVLSGPPNAPALYDDEGRSCGPAANAKCIFEVITQFTASCGIMPSPCTSAQDIIIWYTVRHARTSSGDLIRGLAGINYSDVTGRITTAVRTILSTLANNYVPMMNGGTTSLTNSRIFQAANGSVGVNTNTPQAALDVNGDISFTLNGMRFASRLTNAGVRARNFAGCYGRNTGFTDTCDGSFQLYQCPAGGAFTNTCFDIQSACGGNGCGGCYFNVTCNAGVIFQQQ